MTSGIAPSARSDVPRLAILGVDAALSVRPSTPVQLAHACLRAGYSLAVPATWGDELVAAECVRQLGARPAGSFIQCSCPLVRQRLLARGADLAPFLVSTVPPVVATARYLRAQLSQPVEIHFIGNCPSGGDAAIDRWIVPDDFVDLLEERGISIQQQPTSYEGILPPDRRRHWSLPGGAPAPDALWEQGGQRKRVEAEAGIEFAASIAEWLLSEEPCLIDAAPAVECPCAGVVTGIPPRTARARVALTEPPRSPTVVIDPNVVVAVAQPIPVAPRVDPPPATIDPSPLAREHPSVAAMRVSVDPTSSMRRRNSGATAVRLSPTSVPVSRQSDGRVVPRAYAAHRRITPSSVVVIHRNSGLLELAAGDRLRLLDDSPPGRPVLARP